MLQTRVLEAVKEKARIAHGPITVALVYVVSLFVLPLTIEIWLQKNNTITFSFSLLQFSPNIRNIIVDNNQPNPLDNLKGGTKSHYTLSNITGTSTLL